MNFNKIFLITLIIKLIFSAWLPLFFDETYYWVWSHNLQLSYFDHPPMISWLFYLGHFMEPFFNAVRWPAVILGHFSFYIWFLILKDHLDNKRLQVWFYLALLTPLTGFGSFILTPDLALIFFWSLALFAMNKAFSTTTQSSSLFYYLLLGSSLGLAFCSKYHAVLFIPCLFIWLTWKKKWLQVQWKLVPLTILMGFIFSLPVIIWNYQNNWQSFAFQLNHGLGAKQWNPQWLWRYFYGQILLIFPTILFFSTKASRFFLSSSSHSSDKGAVTKKPLHDLDWLPFFAWFPILFFLLTSFKGKVEANWPSIAYPSFIALALFAPYSLRWLRGTFIFWGIALIIVSTNIYHHWLPINQKKLKTYELTKYKPLYKVATSYTPFFASNFQMASKLSYELKSPIYKLKGMNRIDFYDSLPQSVPLSSYNSYFLAAPSWQGLPSWAKKEKHTVINQYPLFDNYTLFEVNMPK